jgi:hypothetical protein
MLPAFSLKTWKAAHGLNLGSSMDIHHIKQLFQDLGVGPYLLNPSGKCQWTEFPFKVANATGWMDGNPRFKLLQIFFK